LPSNAEIKGVWGVAPNKVAGAVAPVFSPFPQGKGGQGVWGYNAYGNPINNNLSWCDVMKNAREISHGLSFISSFLHIILFHFLAD